MAKICFYCGRELQANEKCTCREGRTAASAAGQAGSGSAGSTNTGRAQNTDAHRKESSGSRKAGPESTGRKGAQASSFNGFFQKMKAAYQNFSRNLVRPSQAARPMRSSKLQTLRDQIRIMFPTFSVAIKSVLDYVIHPASRIRRESLRPKRRSSIPVILVLSLMSGILGMMFTQAGSPLFDSIMLLVLGNNTSLLFVQPFLSMVGFSLLTLLLILTMAICFFLGAWLTKNRLTFRKVLDILAISFVYLIIIESLLLLGMILGSRGSLTMILFSLLVMSVAQYLGFRNALSLKEDTAFLLLIFVYSSCYVLYLSILDMVSLIIERI